MNQAFHIAELSRFPRLNAMTLQSSNRLMTRNWILGELWPTEILDGNITVCANI